MKQLFFLSAILILTIKLYGQQQLQANQTDQVMFKFKDEFSSSQFSLEKQLTGNAEIDNINKKYNLRGIKRIYTGKESNQLMFSIKFPVGTDVEKVIEELYKTGAVEAAEPDYIGRIQGTQAVVVPNDQYFSRQWGLHNNGSFSLLPATAGDDINMENAWAIEEGDSTIVVGIIDSGCRLDHPEFSGRIGAHAWNFAYNNSNPTDDQGHGTNVAGIIGANGNNGIGYAGMDWHCKLMILKAIDSTGTGYVSWWISAVNWAVEYGANVINMSVGVSSPTPMLQTAINNAYSHNVVVVAAMGNNNSNVPAYPAACTHVIAVGSINPNDTRSDPFYQEGISNGSNYGPNISVVAPGNCIYGLSDTSNTDYGTLWSGTSQATPHVTGLASLLLAQNHTRTPDEIKSIIETTAFKIGTSSVDTPGWNQYFGYGRINAYQALLTPAGIAENEQHHFFEIFPNPSSGNFIISSGNLISKGWIQLYNTVGQKVFEKSISNSSREDVNLENISAGVYFARLNDGENVYTQKLIVR